MSENSKPTIDQDKLLTSTDAQVWATEFAKVRPDVDEGLMLGWFANAIETSWRIAKKDQISARGLITAIEDLIGWLDAASDDDEPAYAKGKVSASATAQALRAILDQP